MYIKVFANFFKFVVDIILGRCYSYYDRRGTTVVTTAIVATTVVTIPEGEIDLWQRSAVMSLEAITT